MAKSPKKTKKVEKKALTKKATHSVKERKAKSAVSTSTSKKTMVLKREKQKSKVQKKASPKVVAKTDKPQSKTRNIDKKISKKEQVIKQKPLLLPKNSMKKTADVEERPKLIATPTDQMLKPFRDAAKRTQVKLKQKQKTKNKATFIAKPLKSSKKVLMDLRVHSPASEGYLTTGGVDPASAMVSLAKAKGLDMIAVTDYHSADFVDLIKTKAENTNVTVIPGLDLKCSVGHCDEISLLALFPEEYGKDDLDKILKKLGIPDNKKGSKSFTVPLSVKEIISLVENSGGVIIPSRIDITPYRLSALRELVESHGFHVFDLAHPDNPEYFKEHWPSGEFTFYSFSNANALGQIGTRAMSTRLPDRDFSAIKSVVARRQ